MAEDPLIPLLPKPPALAAGAAALRLALSLGCGRDAPRTRPRRSVRNDWP